MKTFKELAKILLLPCFAIVMGIVILSTQRDNPDFIISRHEYLFAGISLLVIGVGLLYQRIKAQKH